MKLLQENTLAEQINKDNDRWPGPWADITAFQEYILADFQKAEICESCRGDFLYAYANALLARFRKGMHRPENIPTAYEQNGTGNR